MIQCSTAAQKEELPKGFVIVLEEECKGCCLCMDACPQDALALSNNLNRRGHRYVEQLDPDPCTGCGLCYIQCPSSAIVVFRRSKAEKESV